MSRSFTPFFAVALILDFSSPKTQPLLKQNFHHEKEVAVYPFRAKEPGRGASTCQYVIEKFVRAPELGAWAKQVEPDPTGAFPLAKTLRKIAFDARFGLHSLEQVIVDVPLHGTRDSCGEDVCSAIAELNRTLQRAGRRVRVQTMSALRCELPRGSAVVLEDAGARSAAQVAERAQIPLEPRPLAAGESIVKKKEAAQPEKIQFGSIHLSGTPVELKLEYVGPIPAGSDHPTPETLQPPMSAHLRSGNWKVSVLAPSWLTNIPGWTLQVKPAQNIEVDLSQALGSEVSWVQSSQDSDLLVALDPQRPPQFPARILVPRGGPAIPLPKALAYKVYQVK